MALPKEPRQKMINLMYLVLTALLAEHRRAAPPSARSYGIPSEQVLDVRHVAVLAEEVRRTEERARHGRVELVGRQAEGDDVASARRMRHVGGQPVQPLGELAMLLHREWVDRSDLAQRAAHAAQLGLQRGELLDELRADVELVDASKIPYGPSRTQEEINRILVERALAGARVVRLKGGDPYVFGRGGEELLACAAAGVPVTVVPGVTSAVSVPAAAGVPVTHRQVAHEFTVVSGHLPPEHPGSLVNWAALAGLRGTLVLLMGLKNLPAITAALLAGGRGADVPVMVVQEGTTGDQRTLRATLGTVAAAVAEAGIRPPAIVVIGDVVTALDAA